MDQVRSHRIRRYRQDLSNEYWIGKFGFDIAENGPPEVFMKLSIEPRLHPPTSICPISAAQVNATLPLAPQTRRLALLAPLGSSAAIHLDLWMELRCLGTSAKV